MANTWRISTQFVGVAPYTAPKLDIVQLPQLPLPQPGPQLLDGKLYYVPPMPRADTFRP